MADVETIKARVRKLMAVAGDGVAADGEIENAMRLAAKLIDQHHLQIDEVNATREQEKPENLTMGRAAGLTQKAWLSTWENTLGWAVAKLFGSVQHYISHEKAPIRVNGIAQIDKKTGQVRQGIKVYYYGPIMEATEAAQLFEEWSRSIATMGVARWGGCFAGDGAKYCYGFARALLDKATKIDEERRLLKAKPIPQLSGSTAPQTTAITLHNRYEILKTAGKRWLSNELGIKLGKRGGSSGYSSGSNDAYHEGHSHGSQAHFGRTTKSKMLPGR